MLQQIGGAIDDGLQQAQEDVQAAAPNLGLALGLGREGRERARLDIADGHQPVAGEDEGDGAWHRPGLIQAAEQGGRHEGRAIVLVEAAGGLDLGHLLAGGKIDADRRFHGPLFLAGGLDQFDPDSVVRQPPAGLDLDGLQHGRVAPQDHEHAVLR